ncbi:hypothetical protein ACFPOG_08025 [Paenibacillus aestuarii]|uniref:Uncharacterized protein n=1 Tax=Paenibacillus aestuarii TaxID=516965 RepID=A0ABW0K4R9_9BACL
MHKKLAATRRNRTAADSTAFAHAPIGLFRTAAAAAAAGASPRRSPILPNWSSLARAVRLRSPILTACSGSFVLPCTKSSLQLGEIGLQLTQPPLPTLQLGFFGLRRPPT